MSIAVKICGISEPAHLPIIVKAGARYTGFVLYPRSPRYVSLEALAHLLTQTPPSLKTVALCVDPDDELVQRLARLPRLDMLQLQGHETPQRIAALRSHWQRPIMKALSVARAEDLAAADDYVPLVEQFLFDPKPPEGGLPGGNA
ncbi:MAG: phosphoribosylanthranilate isomerase, partial [Alphaproteobacteria bacterium]|nr:phosphoribosylanthranilate isomerase [Alphaproteobacteria bacterium]